MSAEVTSNSTPTPCSSLRKKAQEDTADAFKPVGSLTFRIDNFRQFTERPSGKASMRHCKAKVSVRGLTFGLAVYPARCVSKEDTEEECIGMGITVMCENATGCNDNGSWNCLAVMTFRVNPMPKSRAPPFIDIVTHKFFSNQEESSLEWNDKQELLNMDVSVEYEYEQQDIFVRFGKRSLQRKGGYAGADRGNLGGYAPVGIMELPKTDVIQVNEEMVFINKNLLATHSRYFHTMFYNGQYPEGQSGVYKVQIEAPTTVEHFKRMLQTIYPENRPLDDQCIEGVLHLANQFLMNTVEGKCLEFLRQKSTKSALFKYRVAEKYGYKALKNHVLINLNAADFKDKMFKNNMEEYNQLGSSAAEAFMARSTNFSSRKLMSERQSFSGFDFLFLLSYC